MNHLHLIAKLAQAALAVGAVVGTVLAFQSGYYII